VRIEPGPAPDRARARDGARGGGLRLRRRTPPGCSPPPGPEPAAGLRLRRRMPPGVVWLPPSARARPQAGPGQDSLPSLGGLGMVCGVTRSGVERRPRSRCANARGRAAAGGGDGGRGGLRRPPSESESAVPALCEFLKLTSSKRYFVFGY
jgi:hypothetical protein